MLREEINRLKGLPRRPMIRPSTLNGPHPDPSHKKKRRGKRPGSAKRQKTGELTIHETIPLLLEGLPEGTRQNGYEDFVIQDMKIEAHNVCDRRLRCLLPDGASQTAPLPAARMKSSPCRGGCSRRHSPHILPRWHRIRFFRSPTLLVRDHRRSLISKHVYMKSRDYWGY